MLEVCWLIMFGGRLERKRIEDRNRYVPGLYYHGSGPEGLSFHSAADGYTKQQAEKMMGHLHDEQT